MVPDPCCGFELHRGAKIVAVVDILFSIIELAAAMVFESGPVTILSTESADPEKRDVNYVVSMTLLFGICLVIVKIAQLGCSILLLYGIVEKNRKKCEIWFIFNCCVVILAGLQILFETMVRGKMGGDEPIIRRIAIPLVEILLNWYLMWVIFAFMMELRKARQRSDASAPEGREMIEKNSTKA